MLRYNLAGTLNQSKDILCKCSLTSENIWNIHQLLHVNTISLIYYIIVIFVIFHHLTYFEIWHLVWLRIFKGKNGKSDITGILLFFVKWFNHSVHWAKKAWVWSDETFFARKLEIITKNTKNNIIIIFESVLAVKKFRNNKMISENRFKQGSTGQV